MKQTVSATFALASCLSLCPAMGLNAQDGGGQSLSFTLSERLESTRNLALTPGGDDTTLQSLTTAALAYDTATRASQFSFDAGLNLRALGGSGSSDADISFADPTVALSYGQSAPDSSLALSASFASAEVAFIRPLSDFIDGDQILLPEDFDDLTGTGNRNTADLNASLSIRDNTRFGLSFSAGVTDISYIDTSDPELIDSLRLRAGVQARLNLTRVATATAGLSYSGVTTDDGDSETYGLRTGFSVERPDGSIGLTLNASRNSDSTLLGFQISRDLALPTGAISASIGFSGTDGAGAVATGSLDYALERPNGTITARLARDLSIDDGDASTTQTALALSATHAFSPDLTGTLRAGLAISEDDSGRTDLADLGASLGYALTPDWSLNAAASYTFRDDGDSANAQSLSLTLTRRFGAIN